MQIIIKQGDWVTKKIPVINRTVMTLKNGRVIPTASNMMRKAFKI